MLVAACCRYSSGGAAGSGLEDWLPLAIRTSATTRTSHVVFRTPLLVRVSEEQCVTVSGVKGPCDGRGKHYTM